jgi:alginate O-acetyltransferase complex protein AlgJ
MELEAAMDGKVVRGKEGWLFLDSDTNQVVRQHSGQLLLSLDDLRHWQSLLESRIERLAESGTEYLFAVAPDAHAVYPEMLPEAVEVAQTRPVLQLIEHLERQGSSARIVYPLEQLLAEKRVNPVFPRPALTGTT